MPEPTAHPVPEPFADTAAEQQADFSPENELPAIETIGDGDETEPALPILDEDAIDSTADHSPTHWQSVTNVVLSEDNIEETQENVALTVDTLGVKDVGIAVFTVDSDFASTAIRSLSNDRNIILATTLVKVAHAIEEQNAGVLVTDFTTNSKILKR